MDLVQHRFRWAEKLTKEFRNPMILEFERDQRFGRQENDRERRVA
jgi:hypothetical protein